MTRAAHLVALAGLQRPMSQFRAEPLLRIVPEAAPEIELPVAPSCTCAQVQQETISRAAALLRAVRHRARPDGAAIAAAIEAAALDLAEALGAAAAVDRDWLARQVRLASDAIADATGPRVVRLNPADCDLLTGEDCAFEIVADPQVARGDVRVDCGDSFAEAGRSVLLDAWRTRGEAVQ